MKIILQKPNSIKDKPISVIITYAPHSGYSGEERTKHWKQVKLVLESTPKTHVILWCTDANGQLGNRLRTQPELAKIIGMNTKAIKQKTETGKHYKTYA